MSKKLFSLLLAAVMMAVSSCALADYTPGTYIGTTPNGRNGAITVEVTLNENAIEGIQVVSHGETPFVSDKAIEEVPQRIVAEQSLRVDGVSGATITSYAVMAAVKDALVNAGVDVSGLSTAKAKEPSIATEELSADLVVVGAGAAGAMMAVRAAELHPDMRIILLEKTANIGGNAVVSGGYVGVYNPPADIACESSEGLTEMLMGQFNVETPDAFSAELLEQAKQEYEAYLQGDTTYVFMSPSLTLLNSYRETGIENTEALQVASNNKTDDMFMWFYNHGAHFAKMLGVAGYSYPESTYLEDYYSGAGYFVILQEQMAAHDNIRLMTETPATELLVENGKAVGVVATHRDGTKYLIHAENVVLATGGYAADTARVKETDTYWGDLLPERLLSDNISGTNSQAMDMAIAAGAATDKLGFTQMFPFANPRTGKCHDLVGMDGILVNKEGKRTVNETLTRQDISSAIFREDDHVMWLISDANVSWIYEGLNMFGQDVQTMLDRKYLYRADTLEELAALAGIDPDGLAATVAAYNAAAMGEAADETGRLVFDGPILEAPFYAQPRTPASHITFGGILRNDDMVVLNTAGEPISGLYAIGECTINGGGITVAMAEGILLAEQLP